jgi:subtilisin family serine protease
MRVCTIAFLLLAAACGGSDSPSQAQGPLGTLSGQLSVLQAVPQQLLADFDVEPNGSLAFARLADAEPAGSLDADRDAVDVFRYVARKAGVLAARVECEFEAEAVLFDLEKGVAGTAISVDERTVFDVVVKARRGSGRYRVRIEPADMERSAEPPSGYLDCCEEHVRGEIVVSPAPGISAAALAQAVGLQCLEGDDGACRLRVPDPRQDAVTSLRTLLARCARLRADGLVRYAEPNHIRRLAQTPDDPQFPGQWALDQIRAPAAWLHTTGDTGVVVAVVDSGIRKGHPDLAGRLVDGYDFVDDDDDPEDETFGEAHGTSVASIIAAATNNAQGIAGVNWNARIMPVRAFDAAGNGTSFAVAQAVRFAVKLGNSSGTLPDEAARVVNLSFASRTDSSVERDALEAAEAADAVLVAAAGNDDSFFRHYPAAYGGVLAVSATTVQGGQASYSNSGSWIDLAAPGGSFFTGIVAATVRGSADYTYASVAGTSFAAPHVSGVAALILSVRDMSATELEQILLTTAQDAGAIGVDDRFGHGIVDAFSAVLAAMEEDPPPLFPGETVEVRLLHAITFDIVARVTTSEDAGLAWDMPSVAEGRYILEAGTDRDFDGDLFDPGEMWGRWTDGQGGETLIVGPAAEITDLDFVLQPR